MRFCQVCKKASNKYGHRLMRRPLTLTALVSSLITGIPVQKKICRFFLKRKFLSMHLTVSTDRYFVMCSVYNTPRLKFVQSYNRIDATEITVLPCKHKTYLNLKPMCFNRNTLFLGHKNLTHLSFLLRHYCQGQRYSPELTTVVRIQNPGQFTGWLLTG